MNSSHQVWNQKNQGPPTQHPNTGLTMYISEKQVNHVGPAGGAGHVYRRLTAHVGVLQVGPRRQELHHVPVPLPDGDVDGEGAALVLDVHRGAVLDQDLQGGQESCPGCVVDGRYPLLVLHVGVCPLFQQQTGHLGVPHHHHLQEMHGSVNACVWLSQIQRSPEITDQ